MQILLPYTLRLEYGQIIQSESELIARIQQKISRTYVSEVSLGQRAQKQSFTAKSRLAKQIYLMLELP